MPDQLGFFEERDGSEYPEGFRYQPDLIDAEEEAALVERIRALPLQNFQFHGFEGKRRVLSFGWRYSFSNRTLDKVDDIPDFLLAVREKAAAFAEMRAIDLQHVLVTEYGAGAAIGWHKDKDVFGQIVGISLLSACPFRLRRALGDKWERVTVIAEPRSGYLLSGEVRSEWEHSIPPVEELRYSLTFRNLRADLV